MNEEELKKANQRALVIIKNKAKELNELTKELEKEKMLNRILLDKIYEHELKLEEEKRIDKLYKTI